jgi:hypothetical protein
MNIMQTCHMMNGETDLTSCSHSSIPSSSVLNSTGPPALPHREPPAHLSSARATQGQKTTAHLL